MNRNSTLKNLILNYNDYLIYPSKIRVRSLQNSFKTIYRNSEMR